MGLEVCTNVKSGANHFDPWPKRAPVHGAQENGVPVVVKLDGREVRVRRVLNTYHVYELGLGYRGPAWQLQLEDYRRVVIFHEERERWLLAS